MVIELLKSRLISIFTERTQVALTATFPSGRTLANRLQKNDMKKITIALLLFYNISFYGQWEEKYFNPSLTMSDVYCVNENVVFVVGGAGLILKSIDGGNTWVPKNSGTTENLGKVRFVNPMVGYTTGMHGGLLKTSDGGETWTPIPTGTNIDLTGLSCVTENIFFIGAEGSYIRKTINGGASFEIINSEAFSFYDNVQFVNETMGYANGNEGFFKTIDGGSTWSLVHENVISFFFLDENTGFVNAADGFSKTIDGGDTFTFLDDFPHVVGQLFATSESVVWGVTHFFFLNNGPPNFTMRGEIDGSGVFHRISSMPVFGAVYFANPTTGYAITGNAVYKNSTGLLLNVNEQKSESNPKIYPNPSLGQINISFPQLPQEQIVVKITDTLGNLIFSQSYEPQPHIVISTDKYQSGIYFISIETLDIKQTQKLIMK